MEFIDAQTVHIDWCSALPVVGTSIHSSPSIMCNNGMQDGSPDSHLQLLKAGLFPTTTKEPRTIFTFQVLDDFIWDNVKCGTSGMNYYSKL